MALEEPTGRTTTIRSNVPTLSLVLVIQCAMLTAVAVVVGELLAVVPNLELTTLIIFLAGAHAGPVGGVATAATTALYFNYFNPFGIAPLPTLVAQGLSWSIVALAGAWFLRGKRGLQAWWALGLVGAGLTLVFDLLTNAAHLLAFAPDTGFEATLAVLGAGLALGLFHVATNAAAFALLARPLHETLERVAPRHLR